MVGCEHATMVLVMHASILSDVYMSDILVMIAASSSKIVS